MNLHFTLPATLNKVFKPMDQAVLRPHGLALCITGMLVTSGCAHVNMTQVAYETLRKGDCQINELEDFCTRNFAKEYREYEQIRQEFLRSQEQNTWRVSHAEAKIENPEDS